MSEALVLQQTVITETPIGKRVEIVYADDADLEQATASVVIRLPIDQVEYPHPEAARGAVLMRMHRLIAAEIEKIPHQLRILPE